MSLDLRAQLLYIAPLLPAGVALAYIISVVFKWEQILARRKYGDKPHKSKDMKVSLPLDKTDIKLQEDSTWTSQIVNAAVPIAYHSFTSVKLWSLERSETISINICLIQIAITMAEFAIDYFRYHAWHRRDLFALGASWSGMALQTLFPMLRSGLTGIASSICIAMLGIFSVLPERPASNQEIIGASISQAEKSDEVDSSDTGNKTPRTSNVHLHIFSVSLLLVYLVRDYQMIVSLQLFLRRDQFKGHKPGQTFRLVMAFVTAFGQTVTGLVTLALSLYGLQMFGWIQRDSPSCCCSSI